MQPLPNTLSIVSGALFVAISTKGGQAACGGGRTQDLASSGSVTQSPEIPLR